MQDGSDHSDLDDPDTNPVAHPSTNGPALAVTDSLSDRGGPAGRRDVTPPPHPVFDPTVPRSQSGSPKKPRDVPLDPQQPQSGMMFLTAEEAVHFVYEYERRRRYQWRKAESVWSKDKSAFIITHCLHCISDRILGLEKLKHLRLRCSSALPVPKTWKDS